MKNTARKTVITLALVVMALSTAYAQKSTATVNIPFTFSVDDVRMPAGEYIISSHQRAGRHPSAWWAAPKPRPR